MRFFRSRPKDESADLSDKQRNAANLFVETAERLLGVRFDYSEDSALALDPWIDRLWDPARPPSEAELDSNTKLMGAYMGEVILRHGGGQWVWFDGLPAIERKGKIANVLNKVYKRQVNGPADSLALFYEEFQRLTSSEH